MTEVVGADLQLEPVGRGARRDHHDPGVVDQQIQAVMPLANLPGELLDRGQVREIEAEDFNAARLWAELGQGLLAARDVPAGGDHVCPVGHELVDGAEAQTGVTAGHHRHLGAQVTDVSGAPGPGARHQEALCSFSSPIVG